MKIDAATRTHVGHVRSRNEDACGLWPGSLPGSVELETALLAVADGMGGHPGGDVASRLAVEVALELGPEVSDDPPMRLRRLFKEAGDRIRRRGREDPDHRGMGTTLTALALERNSAWVGHIGDTRLYWIRAGRMLQITRDHTVAQDLIEAGALAAEDAEQHPSSHILTRCLGVCDDQSPDLLATPLSLAAGDRLLLASDGLVKVVLPSRAALLLDGIGAEAGADRLIEASLAAGAPDNVTVILAAIVEVGPSEPGALAFEEARALEWVRG